MVNLLLTGTPGTGKTTAAAIFSKMSGFRVIGINEAVGEDYLYIEDDSKVVDPKALSKKIKRLLGADSIIEGHLAHLLDINGTVIVLRTNPVELRTRLEKKGFSGSKLWENLEAEALDICLIESMEHHKDVYEIDTSDKKPDEVAGSIHRVLKGDTGDFKPGGVSWLSEYLILKEHERVAEKID